MERERAFDGTRQKTCSFSRHWNCGAASVHLIALVAGVAIVGLILWDAFETLAVDLAQLLGNSPHSLEDRLSQRDLAAMRRELEQAGLRLNHSNEADRELAALRRSYEPYLAAMSGRLMMPLSDWRRVSQAVDNSQTEPSRDGGAHL
jgi:hypothetical protein